MHPAGALTAIGNTPLVELPTLRPKGGARILAKWEGANPTASMKDRMALAMIQGALREGELTPGQRVVEYTGGSTGSSLAFVCAALGHPLSLVTADCFALEKIQTMRTLGADVEVLSTPEGKTYPGLGERMVARAERIVEQEGAHWTDQIHNTHQYDGYRTMGREILQQAPGITDFVASVGTGGCSTGNALAFREAGRQVRLTLVDPAEAPYIRIDRKEGSHTVEGIAVFRRSELTLLRPELVHAYLSVPEAEGRQTARRVARDEGLLIGPSSGLNLAAAVRVAQERDPDDVVVTVLVDSGLKYLGGDLFR